MAEPRPNFGARGGSDKPPADRNDTPHGGGNMPRPRRVCTVHLSVSLVVTSLILMLMAGVCLFMFGVIVGRGQNPENPWATLLPSRSAPQDAADGTVLPAEDLRYAQNLKGKRPPLVGPPTPPATPPGAPPDARALSPQQEGGQAVGGIVSTTPASATVPPAAPVAAQAPPAGQLFDYTVQVATLNSEDAVDALRARLEGQGLRTRRQKDGKNYRVLVLLRGTEAQAAALRQQMIDMKLGQPLQRARTPVPR